MTPNGKTKRSQLCCCTICYTKVSVHGGNHDIKYKIKIFVTVYVIGGGNVKDTIGYIQKSATETFHEFTSL